VASLLQNKATVQSLVKIINCLNCWAGPVAFSCVLLLSLSATADEYMSRGEVIQIAADIGNDDAPLREIVPFVGSVAYAESDFKPDARSRAGAQGLMQLTTDVREQHGVTDAYDPEENIRGGMIHLAWYYDECRDDIVLTLAAYNAGQRNVRDSLELILRESPYEYPAELVPYGTEVSGGRTSCLPEYWQTTTTLPKILIFCQQLESFKSELEARDEEPEMIEDLFADYRTIMRGRRKIKVVDAPECEEADQSLSCFFWNTLDLRRLPIYKAKDIDPQTSTDRPYLRETVRYVIEVVDDFCLNNELEETEIS